MASKKGKLKKPARKKKVSAKIRIFKFSLKAVFVIAMIIFFFVLSVYLGVFGPIPTKSALSRIKNHSASLVHSHDGKLIGKYFLQNRMTIDHDSISPHVINALVATEDSRFFKHKGLDFVSLGRVLVKSILFGNRSQGGGSTISQQLARNLYPRTGYGKFTLPVNKMREIFISSRLEKVYTKDEVLALYLNTVPFGDNIFGIEVAAQQFFGQPSSTLNPPEAAVLVGMLAANTTYNPRINPDKALERRNIVLDRMAHQGFLTAREAESYKSAPLILNYKKLDYNNGPAPYFMGYIRPKVEQILRDNYSDDYNIYTDGLIITTSLDSSLQEYASQSVNAQLIQLQKEFEDQWAGRDPWAGKPGVLWTAITSSPVYKALTASGKSSEEALDIMRKPVETKTFDWRSGKGITILISPLDSIKQSLKTLQAGFLAIDPSGGHILAWVGGRNFEFFRFDHITAHRQVGSTFKPFLYTTALLSGIDPCEYISNEVRTYPDFQDWSPENSDGNHEGWYSVKGGLINSVNTISAELIHLTGIQPVIEQAVKMGIKSSIPEVPSIALGTADLTLQEMVTAYSSFANLGRPAELVSLLRIEDWQGNLLWEAEKAEPADSAFNSETGLVMVEIMKGVIERGTGRSLRSVYGLRGDLAGKTGTTQDNADGWFIGYNPALVAGAWVGADNPSIHFRTTALGQGAHTALPIFARFIQTLEKDPGYRSMALAQFPPLPDALAGRLDCPDYSIENPNPGFLKKIFDRLLKSDTTKARKVKEQDLQKQKEEQKKGFFQRLKNVFKRKKSA